MFSQLLNIGHVDVIELIFPSSKLVDGLLWNIKTEFTFGTGFSRGRYENKYSFARLAALLAQLSFPHVQMLNVLNALKLANAHTRTPN